jgi:hypothetical protein
VAATDIYWGSRLTSSAAAHPLVLQGQPLLWLAQHALNPLQQLLADNCHLMRDPISMIETVFGAGNVQAQRFSVDGASLIAPHVAGLARRT